MDKTKEAFFDSSIGMREKDFSIMVVRVLGMLMIIGCHLSSWLNLNVLAMVLNVGVYIFLLISGILYSKKSIENVFVFVKKRWLKLCIPMYILAVFLSFYNLINGRIEEIKAFPIYLFNIQGIGFIRAGLDMPSICGMEHLWFLSVVMICYFLLIGAKKFKTDKLEGNVKCVYFLFICMVLITILGAYVRMQLCYFLTFFVGYAIGNYDKIYSCKQYYLTTFVMVCAMILRLLGKEYADGTILYNVLIVSFTHTILAIWIYITIKYIFQKNPDLIKMMNGNKVLSGLEKLSLYIYNALYVFSWTILCK